MSDAYNVIAAIKNKQALDIALKSDCRLIFLLKGEIGSVKKIIERCHNHNKKIFIHLDMIDGFGRDEAAVKYVKEIMQPDGIITTKANLVKVANECDLPVVFRVFLVDSQSVETAIGNINRCKPKYVEIMPGIVPELIGILNAKCETNFIAGGLISNQKHMDRAFQSGAIACSTSCQELWNKESSILSL